MNITIKIMDMPDEELQVMKLNYNTFVEEIPQHTTNTDGILKDKFHEKNTYIIAKDKDEIVGMLCINGLRPFSLDSKLENIDNLLPIHNKICEIRLLAVKKESRGGAIFLKLMLFLKDYAINQGYDIAVISGITSQQRLYSKIGFKAFGSITGTATAAFQPMYLTFAAMQQFLKNSENLCIR